MKRIIIAILIAMLMIPALATAQETTEPEAPQWRVMPLRSIIWIGEDLIMKVNGTANTSYSLEMRPIGENNTLLNATYTGWHKTDINGTDWAVVPDGYNEEPGQYRVQVVLNQLVVASADVRVDYSRDRWLDIQIDKLYDMNDERVSVEQDGLERDGRMLNRIRDLEKEIKVLWFIILLLVATIIPVWMGAYKDRCETKRKRSRFIEILEGVEEDRHIYYGGTVTGAKPKRMYGGANSCTYKADADHNGDTCPHCALDQWAMEMGLADMTHAQIIEHIGGGKKVSKPKVSKPGRLDRWLIWREYNKKKTADKAEKPKAKKDDKKKVKS